MNVAQHTQLLVKFPIRFNLLSKDQDAQTESMGRTDSIISSRASILLRTK